MWKRQSASTRVLSSPVTITGLADWGTSTATRRFVNGARKLEFFKLKVQAALDRAQKLMAKGVKPQDVYVTIMKKGKTKAVYSN